jgi:hypothetical protein
VFIFRVDEVRNPHEMFGVERGVGANADPAIFAREEYDALLRETDVFVDAFASTGDNSALIEGVRREGRLVTGNFFRVLGVHAERGCAFTPADDSTRLDIARTIPGQALRDARPGRRAQRADRAAGHGLRAARAACRRADRRVRAAARSRGVRREPRVHRGRVRGRGVDSALRAGRVSPLAALRQE